MRYAVSATRSFGASHQVEDHPTCHRLHGHTWTVRVTISHPEMATSGYPRGGDELGLGVESVVRELRYRDLGEMLPGIRTTVNGLAAWFAERMLSSGYAGVTEVEVWNEDESASLTIESRRA